MPHLKQGLLISVEGIDGSGKSTLSKNLFSLFTEYEYDALLTREPGDTPLGKKIRELVQQKDSACCSKAEFLLFAADRAQHFDEVIIPALTQNKLIISDRLADSSLAYQGYGRNLDVQQIQAVNRWAMNGVNPHLTIFVKIPVEQALERVNKRNQGITLFEKKEFLKKVAHGFEALYKNRTNVIIIDGTLSPDIIAQESFIKIEQWIQKNNIIL